jgi:hypothetical protein
MEIQARMTGDNHSMDPAEASPDQVAKTVFWVIALSTAAFVAGVLILIR